jgi:3-phosphoshikimate 1-carboxyvinyltransferase
MITLSAPNKTVKADLELPGSKSISNRLLMIREIHGLQVLFKNLSESEDTVLLAKALGSCRGKKNATIDVHHAGTDMRFLTAYLSTKAGEWMLTGSERMKQRPIAELVEGLKKIGADISYLGKQGFPPLKIKGKKLSGGKTELDAGISSQFISALLLNAPMLEKGLEIELKGEVVSKSYIQMTIELLRLFGGEIEYNGNIISCKPCRLSYKNTHVPVESDWSSASYWYSITALSQNAEINLRHLNRKSLQPDSILPSLYNKLGVKTEFTENGVKLSKQKVEINEFEYDFKDCPDMAQTVAATCFGLSIKVQLNGLQTLKHKETDRILALKTELEKMGAKVEITDSSLKLLTFNPQLQTSNFELVTYSDHRMALSFAPLALVCKSITIGDEEVINKSYPGFWDDLGEAGFELD